MNVPPELQNRSPPIRRRGFLGKAAVLLGGLAYGGKGVMPEVAHAGALPLESPEWSRRQGSPVAALPYGMPSEYEQGVTRHTIEMPTNTSSASLTPLQHLHGIITPSGLTFERHHAGVPSIDPDAHRFLVHGLVGRSLAFTMADLMRFPSVSRICFLECAGNTQGWELGDPALTVQQTHGLLSCCEWTGVPLSTVLEEAGIKPEATWMLAEGADAALMSRSVPMERAMDDAMLVYAQNGERLRPEQGYPLRLLLPGLEGNMNVKWLRRIKVGKRPFETREETAKYTSLMPNGMAEQFNFVLGVKSVITFPSGGHRLGEPGFYEISGLAWSGSGKIRSVDVSTDGGGTWRHAKLQRPVLRKCLTRFRAPWRWNGGPATLQSRAIDETGAVQPTREQLLATRGGNAFYHYNGIHSWKLDASGQVANAS